MKNLLLIISLLLGATKYSQSQNGGACLYMLPSDSTIVCNVYGNGGVPSQGDCYDNADAAGAIPMDCYAYLQCASNTYPDPGGNGCFYAGAGGCGGSATICDLISLPVELTSFKGEVFEDRNVLTWTTVSELNSDYYEVRIFGDNMDTYDRLYLPAAGNSTQALHYKVIHHNPRQSMNYYQLVQYDFDGQHKEYEIIALNNTPDKRIEIGRYDLLGKPVDEYYKGLVIVMYDDYSTDKIMMR